MSNLVRYIVIGVIFIFLQMLINDFINIWVLLSLNILPLLIIAIPLRTNRYLYLFIAFFIGLFVDLLQDGTLGVNAAAALTTAYFRGGIVRVLFSQTTFENIDRISIKSIGLSRFLIITSILYCAFSIVYLFLDNIGNITFMFTVKWLLINIFANTAIALLLDKIVLDKIIIYNSRG